ncbi:putative DNA-binding transcriptional regulator YafY [Bacillus mesophilus]|uniref:WYL domain-containing protein n=1 Tax=Bacillus mesophilus TaxID=1808955 RepID=A0A6M0Q547_9BACI|nr:hypothetical protein [Bacillus mesophilus]MBM7659694.1 putative DNA-binding transcriptional regulator YafY [Bacillus mesophilus]NEY70560.1 hypothetical protein [Bacillus mesophilus]
MNTFQLQFQRLLEKDQAAEIIYLASNGELSHRVIHVKEVTPYYIRAYCNLRKTTRTFSLQNILSVFPKQAKRISPHHVAAW